MDFYEVFVMFALSCFFVLYWGEIRDLETPLHTCSSRSMAVISANFFRSASRTLLFSSCVCVVFEKKQGLQIGRGFESLFLFLLYFTFLVCFFLHDQDHLIFTPVQARTERLGPYTRLGHYDRVRYFFEMTI